MRGALGMAKTWGIYGGFLFCEILLIGVSWCFPRIFFLGVSIRKNDSVRYLIYDFGVSRATIFLYRYRNLQNERKTIFFPRGGYLERGKICIDTRAVNGSLPPVIREPANRDKCRRNVIQLAFFDKSM